MVESSTVQCPACGKAAAGKFCQHCGAALSGAPSTRRSAPAIVPWAALGLATVALVVSLWSALDKGSDAVQPTAMRFSAAPPAEGSAFGQPPDLSGMSPREAADRLFNRVMTASEQGNSEEALRFAPMAIGAYERAGKPDNDARYHLALLHMTAGDLPSAGAQIDQLRKAVPQHLLALMLEHELAERSGNREKAAGVNKAFLAAYDKEIAQRRPEYLDHHSNIERFRAAARGGK